MQSSKLKFCLQKNINFFCRTDPKLATDKKEKTPLKIALERDNSEIVFLLSEAIGEEVPDKVKLEQLSKAMYREDKEEAKSEFSKILASLSPDVVSFLSHICTFGSFVNLGEQHSYQ